MLKHTKKLRQKNNVIINSKLVKFYLPFVFFVIFAILYLPTPLWHFPDGIGYYSYMPAIFKYKNYDFYSILRFYKINIIGIGPKGFIINDFDIGYSLICYPIYLISKVFGRETISILMTNFFASLLGILSILIMYEFLKKYLEKKQSQFICFCLFIGTPLLFYSYSLPQNPHTILAFLCSLYFYFILNLNEKNDTLTSYSLMGIILGVICAVRLQRIILTIPLMIDTVVKIIKTKKTKRYLLFLAVFTVSFILGYSPQLINSMIQFGNFMPPKLYTLSLNKYIFSSMFEVLFSSYHSLLLWTPIIIVSLLGFIFSLKSNFLFSIKFLLIFIAEIFIISLVISPGGGSSFGIRYLADLVFIIGLGLYSLIKLIPKKFIKSINILLFICSMWTFILFILSTNGKIDLLEVYPIKDFFFQIFDSIRSLKINLKPRYLADSDVYLFLTLILVFVIYAFNKLMKCSNPTNSKILPLTLILYLLFFNTKLTTAGFFNRVVYKKEIYQSVLYEEDYQKIYALAGIKIRLKYYNITNQKNKFDYYISLKNKLWPKTKLGKLFAEALYADFGMN